jgi:DNA-binding NtrC family response regulator
VTSLSRLSAGRAAPVLVVDDEAPMRVLLAARLRHRGFHALTAASADEALAVTRSRSVGLVISDYAMGRKSGLDLLAELRAEQPDVPFVLASVLFPGEVPELARRAGAQLVIGKNRLLHDLSGVLKQLIP